jgi:hypothetical protein
MPSESLAEGPAPPTIGGLNSEDTAALDIAITGEEVWSRRVVQRATTHETLTAPGQIDSGLSPVVSDTGCSGQHPRREGCRSSRIQTWLVTDQRSPLKHDWRPT